MEKCIKFEWEEGKEAPHLRIDCTTLDVISATVILVDNLSDWLGITPIQVIEIINGYFKEKK